MIINRLPRSFPISRTLWTANGSTLDPYNSNIVAAYEFEDNLQDRSGHGLTLTDNNTVNYNASGKYNKALQTAHADGDYASLPNATYDFSALAATKAFTISCWFKDSNAAANNAMMGNIGNPGNGFYVYRANSTKYTYTHFANADGNTGTLSSSTAYNDNNWHHFCLVVNGANATQYFDGSADGTTSSLGTIGDAGYDLNIAASSETWDGLLDCFYIFNVAISADAVTALYNGGAGAFYLGGTSPWTAQGATLDPLNANLVAYWPLQEANGNSRIDLIGSVAAAETANPVYAITGKYNNCSHFNGTGYLKAPNASLDVAALVATKVFTFDCWFANTMDGKQAVIFDTGGFGQAGGGLIVWQRNNDTANRIAVGLYYNGTGGRHYIMSSNTYNDGNFHHLAVYANGSTMYLRIDDTDEGSVSITQTIPDTSDDFAIGCDTYSGSYYGQEPTGCWIDELAIWDASIGTAGVTARYNSGTGAFYLG